MRWSEPARCPVGRRSDVICERSFDCIVRIFPDFTNAWSVVVLLPVLRLAVVWQRGIFVKFVCLGRFSSDSGAENEQESELSSYSVISARFPSQDDSLHLAGCINAVSAAMIDMIRNLVFITEHKITHNLQIFNQTMSCNKFFILIARVRPAPSAAGLFL